MRGSLDICVREADGGMLVADLKTTALGGREPEAVVESEYALQRAIYALAALRSGAPAAEIAFCFLQRPEAPVTRRYGPEDAERSQPRCGRQSAGCARRPSRRARATTAHRAPRSTASARRPAGGGGARMTRLSEHSPPESRVRAILRRLRVLYPDARCSLDFRTPWELLVATILSAQCTDERVNMVTPGLFRRYPDPQAFADAGEGEIAKAIFQTGFHNQKARSLRGAALAVLERHGGRVPRRRRSSCGRPGWAARPPPSSAATRSADARASRWTRTWAASRSGSGSRSRAIRRRSNATSWRSCRARPGSSGRTS